MCISDLVQIVQLIAHLNSSHAQLIRRQDVVVVHHLLATIGVAGLQHKAPCKAAKAPRSTRRRDRPLYMHLNSMRCRGKRQFKLPSLGDLPTLVMDRCLDPRQAVTWNTSAPHSALQSCSSDKTARHRHWPLQLVGLALLLGKGVSCAAISSEPLSHYLCQVLALCRLSGPKGLLKSAQASINSTAAIKLCALHGSWRGPWSITSRADCVRLVAEDAPVPVSTSTELQASSSLQPRVKRQTTVSATKKYAWELQGANSITKRTCHGYGTS